MPVKTAIYEPPKQGLPYLIVTFASDGLNVLTANSASEARMVVSERMIRRRRERKSEEPIGNDKAALAPFPSISNQGEMASEPCFDPAC
jgi:hypothetical protein